MLVPILFLALATPPIEPERASAAPPALTPATEPGPRLRPLGPVGSGGIVVGGAGLGVAIAGIVRMTQPDPPTSEPGKLAYITFIDTRIQGGIVLGAGLAVAAAGATMLAIDLTVLRKRSSRRLAIAPALAPTMAGLDLRIRFSLGRAGS